MHYLAGIAFLLFAIVPTPSSAANDQSCIQTIPGVITFYAPGPNDNIEGPFVTSQPSNETGKRIPMTLDDVRLKNHRYVTLAANPEHYGKQYYLGSIEYQSPIDGKWYRLDDVMGYVHDTGPAFRSPGCEKWGTCADIGRKFDVAVSNFTGWSGPEASRWVDKQPDGRNAARTLCQTNGPVTSLPTATFVRQGERPDFLGQPYVSNPPGTSPFAYNQPPQVMQASVGQGATASGGASSAGGGTTINASIQNDVPGVNSSSVPGPAVATLVVQAQSVRRGNPILVAWSTLGMKTDNVCRLTFAGEQVAQGNGGARPVTIPLSAQAGIGVIVLTCNPMSGAALEKRASFTIE